MKTVLIVAAVVLTAAAARAENLAVAVAANMMPAMEEIGRGFTADTGVELALTPGASGKFAAQIGGGAPFDLFVSADMDYPDTLFKEGLCAAKTDRYAVGTLILWTLKDVDLSKGLTALSGPGVKKIAVADPKTAPYGKQAVAALKAAGLYDRLADRLVYGDSLAQVNQFVASQAADVGFAARSIVEAKDWKGKGRWVEVDPKLYTPIDQGLVVLKRAAANTAAKKLRDFILGKKGRAVLKSYGYRLP